MASVWDFLKNLVRKEQDSSSSNPFIHEVIERDSSYEKDYEHWLNSREPGNLSTWILQQFTYFNDQPDWQDGTIVFVDKPTSSGFVIFPREPLWTDRSMLFFFDFLKQVALSEGYQSYLSDKRVYNKGSEVEEVHRHYLKPPASRKNTDTPVDQLYGNIAIDLVLRNQETYKLQLTAQAYNDRNYAEARPFGQFIQEIASTA